MEAARFTIATVWATEPSDRKRVARCDSSTQTPPLSSGWMAIGCSSSPGPWPWRPNDVRRVPSRPIRWIAGSPASKTYTLSS